MAKLAVIIVYIGQLLLGDLREVFKSENGETKRGSELSFFFKNSGQG